MRRTLGGEQSSAFIHHDVKTRDEYAKWIYLWRQNLWQEVTSTATTSYQARFKFGVYGVPNLLRWHVTFPHPPHASFSQLQGCTLLPSPPLRFCDLVTWPASSWPPSESHPTSSSRYLFLGAVHFPTLLFPSSTRRMIHIILLCMLVHL